MKPLSQQQQLTRYLSNLGELLGKPPSKLDRKILGRLNAEQLNNLNNIARRILKEKQNNPVRTASPALGGTFPRAAAPENSYHGADKC